MCLHEVLSAIESTRLFLPCFCSFRGRCGRRGRRGHHRVYSGLSDIQ